MNNKTQIEIDKEYLYQLYKAEKTLWYFNSLIEKDFSDYNAVKFKNEEDTYVWLENVKIEGKQYFGCLPENNVQEKVLIDDIIDWMIIENGRLLGGYTIRYYRDSLDDDAKINFDIDFGVRIDDGNDFFVPNLSTPEGAIVKLEEYYSNQDLEGILSCKNFMKEAENLLKASDHDITTKLKVEMAEVLKLALIENLQSQGFPEFKNIERVFNILDHKNDEKLIEEKIIYKDKSFSINKFWTFKEENGDWKVLNLVE